MRRLRYSINVTLDGCCHHEAGLPPDEESMSDRPTVCGETGPNPRMCPLGTQS